jgi:hypothetical protein
MNGVIHTEQSNEDRLVQLTAALINVYAYDIRNCISESGVEQTLKFITHKAHLMLEDIKKLSAQ